MRIAVLAASGATGRQLTRQALERGHHVTALVRDPARFILPDTHTHPDTDTDTAPDSGSPDVIDSGRLRLVVADVGDQASISRAVADADVVLSGLGSTKGGRPDVLTAGATALVQAGVPRIIWLSAFGTGDSAPVAGALTRRLLALVLGAEIPDKVEADRIVLAAGGTVLHAGPLTNGPLSPTRRTLSLADVPHRLFPRTVSRATVAAAMLDQAEAEAEAETETDTETDTETGRARPAQVLVPLTS